MSEDPLGVREGCAWVVARARQVRIGGLDTAVAAIAAGEVPPWDGSRHFSGPAERTRRYMVVLDTLNFSFWGGSAGGYWELAERLRDVYAAGDELESPERLGRITSSRLGELIGPLPMLEERAAGLRELAAAGPDSLIAETAAETARRAARLRSFDDVAEYAGRRIPFLKRAQILAADLAGSGVSAFPDLDRLTCFADYKLPQILREWGAIEYGDELSRRVDGKQELTAGEPAEVEIRAATVVTVERLREELAGRGRALRSIEVDWMLWQAAQDLPAARPYHRVRTIFY